MAWYLWRFISNNNTLIARSKGEIMLYESFYFKTSTKTLWNQISFWNCFTTVSNFYNFFIRNNLVWEHLQVSGTFTPSTWLELYYKFRCSLGLWHLFVLWTNSICVFRINLKRPLSSLNTLSSPGSRRHTGFVHFNRFPSVLEEGG